MKFGIRILCLVLLVCMLPLGLIACGDGGSETTKKPPSTRVPGDDGLDAKWDNYTQPDEFEKLYIAYNEVVNKSIEATGTGNSLIYLQGPDEETGDLSRVDYKAAYERHALVCDVLGLEMGEDLVYTMTGWDYACDSILPTIEAYNNANAKDTPNIIIHQNYGMVRAGITGQLYNALDDDPHLNNADKGIKNWFDLTADGWYYDMMMENTLSEDHVYMLMGDYFIDQLRFAFGVLVNNAMIDDVCAVYGGMEYLYDLVRNGEWDYDTMFEIALWGYYDDGAETIMGIIGDSSWTARTFFASSGLDIFKKDASGNPSYITAEGNDVLAIHNWLDSMVNMQKEAFVETDWGTNLTLNTSRSNTAEAFIQGRSVFAINQMILSFEGANIQNMDDAASIVPTPMYQEMWKETADGELVPNYRALTSDNAGSGGILITSSFAQFSVASAFLQLMTEQSEEFFTQYYDAGLKLRDNSSGSQGHIEMLDFIHEGICSPMSFLYDNYCSKSVGDENIKTYGWIMQDVIKSGTNTFASSWKSQHSAKVTRWTAIKGFYGYGEETTK